MKTKILFTVLTIVFFTASISQAQEKKHDENQHEHTEMKMDKTIYVCPMHKDEKSMKAGECSKCGMKMKKMEMKKGEMKHDKEAMKMKEGEMKHNKEAIKMKKTEMKEGEMKHDKETMKMNESKMAKAYMCPMKCEGEKTYDKAGDCPKCGMELKEKKKEDDHDGHKH
jgi:uncharacterized paraquat-inducible protein A